MHTAEFKQLLKHLILLESTRLKRETGANAERWQEKLIRYEKAGGFFVHFSTIPKMGLFARNKFGTPIGFYAYPLNREKMKDFAVERPYALIIKPKPEARLLDLRSYSEQALSADIQKLVGLKYSKARIKTASESAKNRTPGGKIWNITRVLSGADKADAFLKKVGKDPETNLPLKGGGPTGKWTMLLRKLGYDGVVDRDLGIIHEAEPSQAVFFDTAKLELAETVQKPTRIRTADGLFTLNFSRRDLRKMEFAGKVYVGGIFFRSNLSGVDLSGLNFRAADFSYANLSGANLRGAILSGVDLFDVNARGADFAGANLEHTACFEANFTGANLEEAILRGANLRKANFTGASLVGAKLAEAVLLEAKLGGADLTNAVITNYTALSHATYNSSTKFPDGFNPEEAGMVKTD